MVLMVIAPFEAIRHLWPPFHVWGFPPSWVLGLQGRSQDLAYTTSLVPGMQASDMVPSVGGTGTRLVFTRQKWKEVAPDGVLSLEEWAAEVLASCLGSLVGAARLSLVGHSLRVMRLLFLSGDPLSPCWSSVSHLIAFKKAKGSRGPPLQLRTPTNTGDCYSQDLRLFISPRKQ